MYFLRWIAGYPILIILLVIGLYTLYNKDNLPHWFQKNDTSEQVAGSEQHGQIAENAGSAEASGQSVEAAASQPSLQIAEEEMAVGSVATADSEVAMNTPEAIAPVPEVDEIPPMPEMGDTPPMSEMGDIPPMPEMGEIPPMPEMDEIPPMPEMREFPPMPEMGEMPAMPEMGQFPPMEPFPEMPAEPAFVPPMDAPPSAETSVTKETSEAAPSADSQIEAKDTTEVADSGNTEEKSGSWLDIFKSGEEESDTTVESTEEAPVLEQAVQEAPVETAEPQAGTEIADVEKEKSGSWLDIFKAKKTETEETSLPSQQEQSVETEIDSSVTTETAEAGQEESGSWLDIFKRNKEETQVEKSDDVSGEYQQQHKESLRLAREAFWKRDYDAAEAIYVNMTKAEPENPALLGEYGNVLLQAGKMGQALDVYEQVAELLIAEGRTFELRPLLYFIGDQDSERAQKITEKMQAQQQIE